MKCLRVPVFGSANGTAIPLASCFFVFWARLEVQVFLIWGRAYRTTGASRVGTVIRQISLRRPAGAVQIVAAQIEGCDEASRPIMTDRAAVSSAEPLLQDPKKLTLL